MAAADYWLETERLALRRFTRDDAGWLCALYADPDVTRYMGGTKSPAELEPLIETRILGYYDAYPGLGTWVTIERATGERVGFHLLNHVWGESLVQIGFALTKTAWGRGFATEMAAALLRYGFVELRLPQIVALASLPNVASQRVLAKAGLHRRGERAFAHPMYAAEGPMAFFERDADAWLAERGD